MDKVIRVFQREHRTVKHISDGFKCKAEADPSDEGAFNGYLCWSSRLEEIEHLASRIGIPLEGGHD